MKLLVKYLDGTEVGVVRTASALRAFEKAHNQPLGVLMLQGSWWADEIAHHVLCQKHGETRTFDEWIDTVETILWERPKSDILTVAQALGYRVREDTVDADPTGGAGAEASRADSSTPPSS